MCIKKERFWYSTESPRRGLLRNPLSTAPPIESVTSPRTCDCPRERHLLSIAPQLEDAALTPNRLLQGYPQKMKYEDH